jgi:hypothetical protein
MIGNHSWVWWWSNENMFDGWWLMRKSKILELCGIMFSRCKLSFLMEHFYQEFPMFGHAHIVLCFIVVCIHLRCYTTSDVHFIICELYEKKLLREFVNQKRKNVPFFLMFFLCSFSDEPIKRNVYNVFRASSPFLHIVIYFTTLKL